MFLGLNNFYKCLHVHWPLFYHIQYAGEPIWWILHFKYSTFQFHKFPFYEFLYVLQFSFFRWDSMAITIFLFLSLSIFKIVIKPLSANSNICAIEDLISFPLDYRSHFLFCQKSGHLKKNFWTCKWYIVKTRFCHLPLKNVGFYFSRELNYWQISTLWRLGFTVLGWACVSGLYLMVNLLVLGYSLYS